MSQTTAIKNKFNDEARKLNCNARIGGNKKKVEFQRYLYTDSKGFEWVQKITSDDFDRIIRKYPTLYNF